MATSTHGKPQARLTKDALRESEDRFRTLAECAPVVVWMTDASQRVTYISKYWQELTGRDPEKDLGFGWIDALHPDDRDRAARDLIDASALRQPCRGDYRVRCADGEYGWLHDYGVPYFRADGSYAGHIGTCMDITQHKDEERAGFEVQNSLVLGQEAERKRVAQELHDDISQRLALVVLELNELEHLLLAAPSPTLQDKAKTLRQHVEAIALDVHRISHNLHPSALVHLGLVSALRRLCREFSEQTRIAVDFPGDVEVLETPEDVAIALYRVTQECLSNIARHSGSRDARVSLQMQSGALRLTIADSGVGFDADHLPTAGLGLVIIRERARMIGAEVQITSHATTGTRVELCVPWETVGATVIDD
jgi:PAS domain S-box-containing protein